MPDEEDFVAATGFFDSFFFFPGFEPAAATEADCLACFALLFAEDDLVCDDEAGAAPFGTSLELDDGVSQDPSASNDATVAFAAGEVDKDLSS